MNQIKKTFILTFVSCFLLDTIGLFIHKDYGLISYILFSGVIIALEKRRVNFFKKRKETC